MRMLSLPYDKGEAVLIASPPLLVDFSFTSSICFLCFSNSLHGDDRFNFGNLVPAKHTEAIESVDDPRRVEPVILSFRTGS